MARDDSRICPFKRESAREDCCGSGKASNTTKRDSAESGLARYVGEEGCSCCRGAEEHHQDKGADSDGSQRPQSEESRRRR